MSNALTVDGVMPPYSDIVISRDKDVQFWTGPTSFKFEVGDPSERVAWVDESGIHVVDGLPAEAYKRVLRSLMELVVGGSIYVR